MATIRETHFYGAPLIEAHFYFIQKEFFKMFYECSEKLKTIAKILFIALIVLAGLMVIVGIALLSEASVLTVTMIISAAVTVGAGYISCVELYGFAEIIENTGDAVGELEETNKRLTNVAETNLRLSNVVANNLPEILKIEKQQIESKENE